MNIVLQLLLAICLIAGLHATGDSLPDNVSDDIDDGFFGMDEPGMDRVTVDDAEDDVDDDDDVTTPAPRRGSGHRHRYRGHHGRQHGRHGGGRSGTAEQKIEHICSVIQSASSSRRMRNFAAKLGRLSPEVREQINASLTARKEEMTRCCQLTGEERMQCVADMRKERYERVCNDEEPLCIWSIMKTQSSERVSKASAIKERCCALQEQERVTCFTGARETYRQNRRSRNRRI